VLHDQHWVRVILRVRTSHPEVFKFISGLGFLQSHKSPRIMRPARIPIYG